MTDTSGYMRPADRQDRNVFIDRVLSAVENVASAALWTVLGILLIMAFASALQSPSTTATVDLNTAAANVFFRCCAIGLLVALASVAVGSFLGLIFGIPRLLQQQPAAAQQSSVSPGATTDAKAPVDTPFFTTNTSFEEISDWLTKIIVGLGLVEFDKLLFYINKASVYAAAYVTAEKVSCTNEVCDIASSGTVAFFFGLIVACVLLSCIFVYLQTRTRLAMLFQRTEQTLSASTEWDEPMTRPITEPSAPAADAKESPSASPAPATDADRTLAKVSRADLPLDAKTLGSWGTSQARLGNYEAAEGALRDALGRQPGDIELLQRLAEVLQLRRNPSFIDIALELIRKAPDRKEARDLAYAAMFYSLYIPPPFGFERALELAVQLQTSEYEQNPTFHLRWACGLGQRHSYEIQNASGSTGATKREVIFHLEKVLDLSKPGERVRREMKRLLNGTGETDLTDFTSDSDFDKFRS